MAYNIVSNAIVSSVQENGTPDNWYYGESYNQGEEQSEDTSEFFMKNYFAPYVKYVEMGQKQCSNGDISYLKTPNGIIFTFYRDTGLVDGVVIPHSYYIVANLYGDIICAPGSGLRNYSKRDILMTIYSAKDAKVHFYGDKNKRSSLLTSSYLGCRKDLEPSARWGCGALLQMDGWVIQKDYPW